MRITNNNYLIKIKNNTQLRLKYLKFKIKQQLNLQKFQLLFHKIS